jgi:hypothetical protein
VSLSKAIAELKSTSTEEEYKSLVESMFLALGRQSKRKVLKNKFSSQVTKALYKKK